MQFSKFLFCNDQISWWIQLECAEVSSRLASFPGCRRHISPMVWECGYTSRWE